MTQSNSLLTLIPGLFVFILRAVAMFQWTGNLVQLLQLNST